MVLVIDIRIFFSTEVERDLRFIKFLKNLYVVHSTGLGCYEKIIQLGIILIGKIPTYNMEISAMVKI